MFLPWNCDELWSIGDENRLNEQLLPIGCGGSLAIVDRWSISTSAKVSLFPTTDTGKMATEPVSLDFVDLDFLDFGFDRLATKVPLMVILHQYERSSIQRPNHVPADNSW